MESLENLHDLFIHELRDLHDAEQQLITALPLLKEAATAEEFGARLKNISKKRRSRPGASKKYSRRWANPLKQNHARRWPGSAPKCATSSTPMQTPMCSTPRSSSQRKKWSTTKSRATAACVRLRVLKYKDAARLLEKTLKEESQTDERLNRLAERLNQKAETADQAAT